MIVFSYRIPIRHQLRGEGFGWLGLILSVFLVLLLVSCSKFPIPGGRAIERGTTHVAPEPASFFFPEPKRKPPKSLNLNRPIQITSEADPVLYAAVSPDGQWLVYPSKREDHRGLWLRSADPGRVILPRALTKDVGVPSSPAFSHDGKWIAFVGTGYDVKGDIYLLKLNEKDAQSLRLTGRETEDGAPCFSPDGQNLYFHQVRPGESRRQLMVLDLEEKDPKPYLLNTGDDAAFPSISPDGKRCAFVSVREDPGGDLFITDLDNGKVVFLTRGPERDLFPVWSLDGQYIYFARSALDTDRDGAVTLKDNAVIFRVKVDREDPTASSVTSAAYSAYQPMISRSMLYFLSNRKGVSNLWSLPLEGEIPHRKNVQSQMSLAEELANQVPPDLHLAILGYCKVLELFSEKECFGGRAAYAIGRLYERMEMPDAAEKAFRLAMTSFRSVLPEAALSGIHLVGINTWRQWKEIHSDRERKRVLEIALSQLEAISNQYPDHGEIIAGSLIEQARLLKVYGKDAGSMLEAIRLLEKVIKMDSAPRSKRAEAMIP